MARYSRIGGIGVVGVSCREWLAELGGNGSRLQLAGEARGRSMGDVRPAKRFDVVDGGCWCASGYVCWRRMEEEGEGRERVYCRYLLRVEDVGSVLGICDKALLDECVGDKNRCALRRTVESDCTAHQPEGR